MKKTAFSILFVLLLSGGAMAQSDKGYSVTYTPKESLETSIGEFYFGLGGASFTGTMDHMSVISFNLGYSAHLSRIVNLGINTTFTIDDFMFAPMLNLKLYWLNRGCFSMYSRIGAGMYIQFGERGEFDFPSFESNSCNTGPSIGFAYQISPIGIELGRKCAYYLEAGWGFTGVVETGLRIRF